MIYCVSDIHGELDKFERMLEQINFCDADRLYIIGDVIDRGAMGVELLQKIMNAANMTMLLGNHEQMCLSTLGPHNEFGARELWRQNVNTIWMISMPVMLPTRKIIPIGPRPFLKNDG